MKYYTRNRSSGAKAKKIMFRILFVLLAAAIITLAATLVGLHLARKVEVAENAPSAVLGTGIQSGSRTDSEAPVLTDAPDVFAVSLDMFSYEDDELMSADLDRAAMTYDTVVFPLSDADGQLVYQSPAVCELVRMPMTDTTARDHVVGTILSARSRGLRIIASVTAAETNTDAVLMKELASYGADEIMIRPSLPVSLDYETANRLRLYLNECGNALDGKAVLGIVLPDTVYLDPDAAMEIQMIASSVSFLGVRFDLTGARSPADIYESLNERIGALLGAFNVYNMRVVIDSDNPDVTAAEYRACAERGITNMILPSYADLEELQNAMDANEPLPGENLTEKPAPEAVANPYATTSGEDEAAEQEDYTDDYYDEYYEEETEEESTDSGWRRWF